MVEVIIHMLCILFICVSVVDRFAFFENLGSEIHRILLGTKKPVQIPYILNCSLCCTFWLCLLYIIITGHFTLIYLTLCVAVAGLNQIAFQLLNLLEFSIINIFKKITKND